MLSQQAQTVLARELELGHTWADLILGVLGEHSGGSLRIREIVRRLEERGVRPPGKSPLTTIITSEVARMARGSSPRLRKKGPGRYAIAEGK